MSALVALALLVVLIGLFVAMAVSSGRGQKTRGRDRGSWRKWTGGS